jgi:hypothetical protein
MFGLIVAFIPVAAFADTSSNPPITLTLDPFQSAPASSNSPLLGEQPLSGNPLPSTDPLPTGARFVPLLKETDQTADTNNRGNFITKHEFGIELRTPF